MVSPAVSIHFRKKQVVFMPYVTVPKDLASVKTKVLFNLTKRQLVCFGTGALIGVPVFFLLKGPVGSTAAAMVMMIVMLPAFLLGVYEKHGQPLETVLMHIARVSFLRPKERPYRIRNFYSLLMKQNRYDEEVARIVRENAVDRTAEKTARGAEKKRSGG
jgi:hypothetical protein